MQIRYLPIGSVCSIDNSNNKYMVIGYNKNDFDFISVLYPDGYLNNDNFIYFNEGQISEIYSLGYKDEYGIMFSKKMNIEEKPVDEPQSGDADELQEEIPSQEESFSPYVFDENGTVIAVNEPKQENVAVQEENTSPYVFDENGTVIAVNEPKQEEVISEIPNEENQVEEDKGIFESPYIFDENGVVIDINNLNSDNESVKEEQVSTEVSNESKIIKGDSRYIFNEEGMVIAVKPDEEVKEENVTSEVESTSPYVFDENGTIVAVNEPKQEEVASEISSEENQVVEKPKYVFDENGFLVSAE